MRSQTRSGSASESQEGHSPWPDTVRPPRPHRRLEMVVIALFFWRLRSASARAAAPLVAGGDVA